MKFIKTIGACFVVVAAVSGALAPTSLADALDPEGFGSLADSPFADAAPTFAKEMAVLTGQGISPVRASRALDVQGEVAQASLVSKVQAAMGDAYAGMWFEPATAQVHIGVTSPAGRRAAQQVVAQAHLAAVVTYTRVRSTWSALIAVQNQWNKRLAKLFASYETMTGLDSQRNAVSVTLSSSVPPHERAVLVREAATSSVNVFVNIVPPSQLDVKPAATCKFETKKAYCEKTIVSGVGIAPGSPEPLCTAGPMLIEGTETYMLTAGHCFAANVEEEGLVEVKVTSAYPEIEPKQKEIGKEGSWVYTKARDMAIVKISAASPFRAVLPTPVPALMAEWGKKTESPQAVIGGAANIKGETNCHEGMTSGEECGKIEGVNVTTAGGFEHLVEDSACSLGGDSGGPFFFSNSKVNNVTMQGMLVRGILSCPEEGAKTWYEPLKDEVVEGFGILSRFPGKQLLTTANETRKVLPFIDTALSGESYPLSLAGEAKAGSEEKEIALANANAYLPATSVSILLNLRESTSLGTGLVDFAGVHEEKSTTKCNTAGDAEGIVLMPSTEFHMVYIGLSPASTLESATLILFTNFVISCGALETTVEAPWLTRFAAQPATGDGTSAVVTSHCSNFTNGLQELSSYYNANDELQTKELLSANIAGTGKASSCQEIKGTLLLSVAAGSTATMFSVLL